MTSIFESKLGMFVLVRNQFAANPNTALLPLGLRRGITAFSNVVSSIELAAQQHVVIITGTATDKSVAKEQLAMVVYSTAASIYAFAITRSDNALLEKTAFNLSALRKAKVITLVSIAKAVYALAENDSTELVDYGVTDISQSTLQAAIVAYETAVPLPRNQLSEKATITKNIDLLFRQADSILKNQIDKLMISQAITYPDMYKTYINNRNLISSPSRGTQLKGKIMSKSMPKGLVNVTVTYVENGETIITKSNGTFGFKGAIMGNATLKLTANGYSDITLNNITVKQGQLNIQAIEMFIK